MDELVPRLLRALPGVALTAGGSALAINLRGVDGSAASPRPALEGATAAAPGGSGPESGHADPVYRRGVRAGWVIMLANGARAAAAIRNAHIWMLKVMIGIKLAPIQIGGDARPLGSERRSRAVNGRQPPLGDFM